MTGCQRLPQKWISEKFEGYSLTYLSQERDLRSFGIMAFLEIQPQRVTITHVKPIFSIRYES